MFLWVQESVAYRHSSSTHKVCLCLLITMPGSLFCSCKQLWATHNTATVLYRLKDIKILFFKHVIVLLFLHHIALLNKNSFTFSNNNINVNWLANLWNTIYLTWLLNIYKTISSSNRRLKNTQEWFTFLQIRTTSKWPNKLVITKKYEVTISS